MRRALVVPAAALALLVLLGPAAAAPTDARGGTAGFYRLRSDPRACPSPICGGWFATAVNLDTRRYVAELDLSRLGLSAEAQGRLEAELASGRALLRGRIVVGEVEGFPALGRLVASEAWRAASPGPAAGTVYRVEDRGIVCVRSPCFSLHAAVLSSTRHVHVSGLGLAGLAPATARGARAALERSALLAAGTVRTDSEGGRTLAVSGVWLRTARAASP